MQNLLPPNFLIPVISILQVPTVPLDCQKTWVTPNSVNFYIQTNLLPARKLKEKATGYMRLTGL